MWTYEMPAGSLARQDRERLYQECAGELTPALRILVKSQKPVQRAFGEQWLEDYQRWVEYRAPDRIFMQRHRSFLVFAAALLSCLCLQAQQTWGGYRFGMTLAEVRSRTKLVKGEDSG